MANQNQLSILLGQNRVDAWNNYRLAHPTQSIDLSGANFQARDLSQCNLSDANLQRANLSACRLIETNFNNSDLQGSFLNWSDCTNANCNGVDFRAAHLQETSFTNTSLCNANFSNTNLLSVLGLEINPNCEGATFYRSLLNLQMLANPHFISTNVSFYDSSLGRSLSDIVFDSVKFEDCTFGGLSSNTTINLTGLILTHVKFTNCLFQNLFFQGSALIRARFDSCQFQHVNFSNATLSNLMFGRPNQFSHCDFSGARCLGQFLISNQSSIDLNDCTSNETIEDRIRRRR